MDAVGARPVKRRDITQRIPQAQKENRKRHRRFETNPEGRACTTLWTCLGRAVNSLPIVLDPNRSRVGSADADRRREAAPPRG